MDFDGTRHIHRNKSTVWCGLNSTIRICDPCNFKGPNTVKALVNYKQGGSFGLAERKSS